MSKYYQYTVDVRSLLFGSVYIRALYKNRNQFEKMSCFDAIQNHYH